MLRAFLLATVVVPAGAFASAPTGLSIQAGPHALTVSEFKSLSTAIPIDVNVSETRAKQGVIPGAVLLSSSSRFQPFELPPQKDVPLVFYCANVRCLASEVAARRAIDAGYTNVFTLPVGISGWTADGNVVVRKS